MPPGKPGQKLGGHGHKRGRGAQGGGSADLVPLWIARQVEPEVVWSHPPEKPSAPPPSSSPVGPHPATETTGPSCGATDMATAQSGGQLLRITRRRRSPRDVPPCTVISSAGPTPGGGGSGRSRPGPSEGSAPPWPSSRQALDAGRRGRLRVLGTDAYAPSAAPRKASRPSSMWVRRSARLTPAR